MTKYHFDRSKPFYPIVMTYIVQLHGFKEVIGIGILGDVREFKCNRLSAASDEERTKLQQQAKEVLGPLQLPITGDADPLGIGVEETGVEFIANHQYLLEYQARAALMCLVMANEITLGKSYRTTDPIWEFLRHCRNAAGHDGKIGFKGGKPPHPAEWRGITLTANDIGRPLLKTAQQQGILSLGDPIALLWDIEQQYPAIAI